MPILAITAFAPQKGRTSIAVGLAQTLASRGKRVLVVDLDDGDSGVALGLDPEKATSAIGAVDMLTDVVRPLECVLKTPHHVDWVAPGEGLATVDDYFEPNIDDLPKAACRSIDELAVRYDWVIVDTPSEAWKPATFIAAASADLVLSLGAADVCGRLGKPWEADDVANVRRELGSRAIHLGFLPVDYESEEGLSTAVDEALQILRPYLGSN